MSKRLVVLVVMDGVGTSDSEFGSAIKKAYKPTLDNLWENSPHTEIKAYGLAVGLPTDDDTGNSEVGHDALGYEQIYSWGVKLINENIKTGEIFRAEARSGFVNDCGGGKMHFLGLLSDGNVHSHVNHLRALIKRAKEDSVKEVCVHVLLDGRDVPKTNALTYADDVKVYVAKLNDDGFHACITSGGGRMTITMDHYETNWAMVKQGWHVRVLGEGREFTSVKEAIEAYRAESGVVDQNLPRFVIVKNGKPVGTIEGEDSTVLFNFRGDRAREIPLASGGDDSFDKFDHVRMLKVVFAGISQYDAGLNIPHNFLAYPSKTKYTLTEELCKHGIRGYAIGETQKLGCVTYFWSGNRPEKLDEKLKDYVKVRPDIIPFEQRPWTEFIEIIDVLCTAIEPGSYDFLHTNYPNGDMVGHTENFEATVIGMESMNLQLARIKKAVDAANGILIVTADHGNTDEVCEEKEREDAPVKIRTFHALNEVSFIIYGADIELKQDEQLGLSNVAATVADLLEVAPSERWSESIIKRQLYCIASAQVYIV